MKRTLLLLFFLLGGVVIGGLIASLCAHVGFLSWLSYACAIGFNPDAPFVLDLSVLQLSFGFFINISVAQIIMVGLAIFLYTLVKGKI